MKSKVLTIFVLLAIRIQAQVVTSSETVDDHKEMFVKIYMNVLPSYTNNQYYIKQVVYSPAILLYNTKGNAHELELFRFEYNLNYNDEFNPPTVKTRKLNLYIRYEYQIGIYKSYFNNKKLCPKIGFSAMPFVSYVKSVPFISTAYPVSNMDAGIAFSLIPRLVYTLKKRWLFDFSIPVQYATFGFNTTKKDNPALPVEKRRVSSFDFNSSLSKQSLYFRLGIGVRI